MIQRMRKQDVKKLTDTQKQMLRELWKPGVGDYVYDSSTNQRHGYGSQFINQYHQPYSGFPTIELMGNKEDNYLYPLFSILQMIEIMDKYDFGKEKLGQITLGNPNELFDHVYAVFKEFLTDLDN